MQRGRHQNGFPGYKGLWPGALAPNTNRKSSSGIQKPSFVGASPSPCPQGKPLVQSCNGSFISLSSDRFRHRYVTKKGNPKECTNYCIIAFNSHASKVMLKILQARLQQYVNSRTSRCSSLFQERPRNQRSNCQHPLDHGKSKRVPEKHLFLLYWLCQSLWLCGSQ